MRILLLLIAIIGLLTASCHHPASVFKKTVDSLETDTSNIAQKLNNSFPDVKMVGDTDQQQGNVSPWVDSLIADYVRRTKNELVRNAFDKEKLQEQWLFDQVVKTDTAVYYSFEVGHDETDKGTDARYVADSWIMIDTVKHKLFEEDANNHLTEWKKQ